MDFGDYKHGFTMPERTVSTTGRGLSASVVEEISLLKNEPDWMLEFRLKAFDRFETSSRPKWGPDLSALDYDTITYYRKSTESAVKSWKDLPPEIRETYDRIGVPEAEKDFLAGVSAQYESEVVYENVQKELTRQGVIFCDMDTAIRKHPDLVREYFGKLVPPEDNFSAALNSSVWSGGSFVYVPKGVRVALPLQAYFRINSEAFGQFERTLIIADEGSSVHYLEGCTAPIYRTDSLHSAVVEIFVKRDAHVRYTTVQNWSGNIYNLVTKRARAEENSVMEWIDCNLGSKVTMKYPAVILAGRGARGEMLSLSLAGKGQQQDTGARMIHLAPETRSRIISKSVSKNGGRSSFRGDIRVAKAAIGCSSSSVCDALILDKDSRSDTYPSLRADAPDARLAHEATVEKIDGEKLFYLASRGISSDAAQGLLVNGFIEPVVKEIPMEYSLELNRLINLEMEESVG